MSMLAGSVGSSPAARPLRLTRHDVVALGSVALFAVLLHGWMAAWDYSVSTFTDSIDYLFMADFYRALLYGGDLERAAEFYRLTRFPPLFPLILGVAGAGTDHQHAASIVSNAIAVLAALVVWWWVRSERGTLAATGIALATLVFPWSFALNLTPVSEPLGLLLCAAALALLCREPVGRTRLLAAGLIIGAAPLARTALLPLVVAFTLWLLLRRTRPWTAMLIPLLAAWTPFLAWSVYRRVLGAHQYTSYLTTEQFEAAGMHWPSALWQQPLRILDAFAQGWGIPSPPAWMAILSGAVLLAAGIGCVLRLRRNRLDGWFLAGYVALILIWPFPSEHTRFALAVYPFLLVCALTFADALDARLARGRPFATALAVTVVLLCAPAAWKFGQRAALPVPDELLGEKREPAFFILPDDSEALAGMEINGRARLLLESASRTLPHDACIYSMPPQFGRLYGRRRVLAYPQELSSEPAMANRQLDQCDYYFVGAWKSRLYDIPPLYPSKSLEGWTEPVLLSNMQYRGRPLMAAALMQRSAKAVPADAPPPAR
jgi:hypothetical protein